ncbi:MAG: hypothetical protein JW810_12215 [Sedimentisphaerales bacterium]|nr:hypothetical protein [Sedimentisphaerales bacterium]
MRYPTWIFIWVGIGAALGGPGRADVLVNGGFESTPFDTGWVNSAGAAVLHPGIVAGSAQAARIRAAGSTLEQSFTPLGAGWMVEFYLAVADPTLFTGANRACNVHVRGAGHLLNMRIAAGGAVQFYDGGNWRTVGAGSEIAFSSDANGDGDFADAGDVPRVHRLRLVGHDYGGPAARYDVWISPANSAVLQMAAADVTHFQDDPFTTGSAVSSLVFRTDYGMVAGQSFVVDSCLAAETGALRIVQTAGKTKVAEANETCDTFTMALSSPPQAAVTVTLEDRSQPRQIQIDPEEIIFLPGDYDAPRTVTVAAIDDDAAEPFFHPARLGFELASSDPDYDDLAVPDLVVTVVDDETALDWPSYSGIYPHLAVTNSYNECGIGAVAVWLGQLWYVSYSPHQPHGSDDKLYQLGSDLDVTIRPESVGGTPANRLIHRESNQLIIGSHLIDAQGQVRTIPLSVMPGRMTANARHLTDPAGKVYFVTMEEGIYEVDVNSLAVTTLHADRNEAGVSDLVPGVHGKGAYTGQGRLVIANNGSGGCLAEWDGSGDAGAASSWHLIDANKYTDVTGPGGIYGNPDEAAPVWAIGWDQQSVLLNVCDQGGQWQRFRLPKASYTQDADHGWFTEWPRIRPAEPNRLLMDMHGMFYEFPSTFGHRQTAGIRPICTHLKMVVDWTDWNGRMVRACNDASLFDNAILGRDQSNLWFGSLAELYDLGRPLGWGGPWVRQAVAASVPSEPFLVSGFERRVVHLAHENAAPVTFTLEVDAEGDGNWTTHAAIPVAANGYAYYILPPSLEAEWVRLRTDAAVEAATAYLHLSSPRQTLNPAKFAGLPAADSPGGCSLGLIRPRNVGDLTLHFAADVLDADGDRVDGGYYEIGADMQLVPVDDPATESWLRANHATSCDFAVDAASVILTDDAQNRYRLPKGSPAFDHPTAVGWPRGIREVVTERSLMNIHGSFYELGREASGGLRRIRPIATHNRLIYDFCSWRGMLVLAGTLDDAAPDDHRVRSTDGKVQLWFGNVDDLFQLGLPAGQGGPWKDTAVSADTPSDGYLMTGYDRKSVELSHDLDEEVTFTLEVDFLADNTWHVYRSFRVSAGQKLVHEFPAGYDAHWVRIRVDKTCTATAWFRYHPRCNGGRGLADLQCLIDNWLKKNCGDCDGADLNADGRVGLLDFAILALHWLEAVT